MSNLVDTTAWASLVVGAYRRRQLTAAEMWEILLGHADARDADERVRRLLRQVEAVFSGPHTDDEPMAVIREHDVIVLEEESTELLAS